MARPGVENKYPTDTHCNEIELCAQHINIVLGYIVNPIERAYVITVKKRERESSLWPLMNAASQITIFVIRNGNWMRQLPIQSTGQYCQWSWKCPQ